MSTYTAATVSERMVFYDALVRAGLEAGNIQAVMDVHYGQIKTFVLDSRGFSEEARAAYGATYFLHGFLREYRKHRTSPTFQEDMAARLATFDKRAARSAAALTRPVNPGPALVADSVPAAPTRGSDNVGLRIGATAAARTPLSPTPQRLAGSLPRSRAASVEARFLTPVSRPVLDRPSAIAGPGPTTIANLAVATASSSAVRGAGNGSHERPLGATARRFTDIEEEEEEEDGEEAIRMMEERMERLGREQLSGMDVDEEGPRPSKNNRKGKAREESDTESDWKTEKENKVRGRSRARRPSTPAVAKRRERFADPTGELFDPPCTNCRLAARDCEKTSNGGACVDCKLKKKRCEYALPGTRKMKSKAIIQTEDERERSESPHGAPERGPDAVPISANGRGPLRPAAATAKPPVDHAQIRRGAARAQTQAKRAAARKAAVEAKKAARELDGEEHEESDRQRKQVPRRPRRATAPRKSRSRSADKFVGRVADRLERLTENAERALAVPRQEVLEEQIRRCEDYITRMSDVVLSLCAFNGISTEGLGPPLFRGVGTVPPAMVSRGVGTDEGVEMGAIELPAAMAGPPSPPPPAAAAPSRSPVAAASTSCPLPAPAPSPLPPPAPAPSPLPPPPSPSPPPSPAHSDVRTDVEMAAATINAPSSAHPPDPSPSNLPVHLIGPTPDNSQEERAEGPIPIPATPPQLPPVFGPPMVPLDLLGMPGTQGAPIVPPTLANPQPHRRGRSRTPIPALLAVPGPTGVLTRARTRSPSPAILAGEKRKSDDKSDGEATGKKRKM